MVPEFLLRGGRIAFALLALPLLGAAESDRYREGQVWEYRTRAGDDGSLLKIQSIGVYPEFDNVPVYHISVTGFRFSNPKVLPELPHAPVSRATLDASVTRPGSTNRAFPDAGPGIAEWQKAHGGVFTISVAEIVALVDQQTAQVGQ